MDRLFTFPNRCDLLQTYGCHFGLKPPGWSYEKHHHHLYELFCCLDGSVAHEVQGSPAVLHPGDWLLLRPGVSHTLSASGDEGLAFFNFHFDLDDPGARELLAAAPHRLIPAAVAAGSALPAAVSSLEALLGRRLAAAHDHAMTPGSMTASPPIAEPDGTSVRPHRASGSAEASARQLPSGGADAGDEAPMSLPVTLELHQQLAVQSGILAILSEVIRICATLPRSPSHHAHLISAYELDIAHAAELRLTADLSAAPSVTAIAAELRLSRSQLSRVFLHVYGLSPRQYLTRRKGSKAKELLSTTNHSVAAISEQLGFRSVNHFSRQFRRWTDLSPSQYRRQEQAAWDI